MPAFTSHTQLAIDGIRHMGFPDYFRVELTICKVIGGLLLITPQVPHRFKEWAYVGFGINFLSASIGHGVVDGIGIGFFFPLIIFGILVISYIYYYKIKNSVIRDRSL